jgi:hypothetical protein
MRKITYILKSNQESLIYICKHLDVANIQNLSHNIQVELASPTGRAKFQMADLQAVKEHVISI